MQPDAPNSPNKTHAPREFKVAEEEPYEHDTDAPENIDLAALLLPDGSLPRRSFALQYNTTLIDGWVKQASPACAAASIAGAWNALMGLKRNDTGALKQDDVLAVYRELLEASCAKKRGRIERLLGADISPIDIALREKVAATGKSFPEM